MIKFKLCPLFVAEIDLYSASLDSRIFHSEKGLERSEINVEGSRISDTDTNKHMVYSGRI